MKNKPLMQIQKAKNYYTKHVRTKAGKQTGMCAKNAAECEAYNKEQMN